MSYRSSDTSPSNVPQANVNFQSIDRHNICIRQVDIVLPVQARSMSGAEQQEASWEQPRFLVISE